MTEVYLVSIIYNYEGGTILGVFEDEKKAKKIASSNNHKGDGTKIDKVEINMITDISI